MKAKKGSRGTAVPMLDLCARLGVGGQHETLVASFLGNSPINHAQKTLFRASNKNCITDYKPFGC